MNEEQHQNGNSPSEYEGVEYATAPEESDEQIIGESAMVDALRRYRSLKGELDVQKRRAKEYVEQVKAEVEADLAPLEARLDRLRTSMQTFVEEYNAGGKFKCAGLGTVYTSKGFSITIADERAFQSYVGGELPGEYLDRVFPRKLSASAAKRLAQEELEETGRQLPGIEAELTRSLNVRLSKPAAEGKSSA